MLFLHARAVLHICKSDIGPYFDLLTFGFRYPPLLPSPEPWYSGLENLPSSPAGQFTEDDMLGMGDMMPEMHSPPSDPFKGTEDVALDDLLEKGIRDLKEMEQEQDGENRGESPDGMVFDMSLRASITFITSTAASSMTAHPSVPIRVVSIANFLPTATPSS
ncbi:hypothetical protein I312_100911 [Cryptococcus bacillisporus CA1280]|uniref:uncharacterized protein n=1 Tax=Cryptococcus bacillisporus CA1280 TaxID=1296109 RepID=UPI003367607E